MPFSLNDCFFLFFSSLLRPPKFGHIFLRFVWWGGHFCLSLSLSLAPMAADAKTELMTNLLHALDVKGEIVSTLYSQEHGISHDAFVGAMKSLQSMAMVQSEETVKDGWNLTEEAKEVVLNGSAEVLLLKCIPDEGILKSDLENKCGEGVVKNGWPHAMRNKWISFNKATNRVERIEKDVEKPELDSARNILTKISKNEEVSPKDIDAMKKRTFLVKTSQIIYTVTKGPKFALRIPQFSTDLTTEMLASGEWRSQEMKAYNLNALGLVFSHFLVSLF
jgi:phenylalanyl-tRNA synthetase alpha chain